MAIGDTMSGSTFVIDLGMFPVETVQQISGLSIEQDAVEIRQVTPTGEVVTRKQSGTACGGEITITRGLDRSKVFTDWIHTTLTKRDVDDARQNITVTVMDPNKNPVQRIHLSRAWASDWQGSSPQAGADESATEEVTITYEDVAVESA